MTENERAAGDASEDAYDADTAAITNHDSGDEHR